ncbi:hypothetical protein ACPV4B_04335 [Vibrio parahaemolyticus]|uniref:hypothetical protein n=1 Tax=Vibrio mediterranei TaxID=689 RepID=UPI0040688307
MNKFSLQFFISLVVAFFAPQGIAASEHEEQYNSQASSQQFITWQQQSALAVSDRLTHSAKAPQVPHKPKSKSLGDHDAKAILSSWRGINNGNESRELELPCYNLLVDFGALNQLAIIGSVPFSSLIPSFYLSYTSHNYRVAGWKDSNTLYVFLNTLYA